MPLFESPEEREFVIRDLGYDPSRVDITDDYQIVYKRQSTPPASAGTGVMTIPKLSLGAETPVQNTPLQTFGKTFAHEAPSAIAGGLGAAGVLSALGGAASLTGAGALIGIPLMLAGGYGASRLARAGQEAIEPESWRLGAEQAAADNPTAALLGNVATIPLSGFRPGRSVLDAAKAVPKLLTGLERTPAETAGLLNTAINAGLQPITDIAIAGAEGRPMPSPEELLRSAAIGAVFSTPNAIGRKLGFPAGEVPRRLDVGPSDLATATEIAAQRETLAQALAAEEARKRAGTIRPQTIIENPATVGNVVKGRGKKDKFVPQKSAAESAIHMEQILRETPEQQATLEKLNNPDIATEWTAQDEANLDIIKQRAFGKPRSEVSPRSVNPEGGGFYYQSEPQVKESGATLKQAADIEQQLRDRGLSTTPKASLFQKFKDWGAEFAGIKLEEDGNVVHQDTGKPVAGALIVKEGSKELLAKLNPNKAGLDTLSHEMLGHGYMRRLKESPRASDREFAAKFEKLVEADSEYQRVKAESGDPAYDPEEFIASQQGLEFIQDRILGRGETEARAFWRDLMSHIKTRFTSGATMEDFRRIYNYRGINQPRVKVSGKVGVGAGVQKNSEESQLESYMKSVGEQYEEDLSFILNDAGFAIMQARKDGVTPNNEFVEMTLRDHPNALIKVLGEKGKELVAEYNALQAANKKYLALRDLDNPSIVRRNQPDSQLRDDFTRYNDLQAQIKQMIESGDFDGPELQRVWAESEAIKNKNKGMPPVQGQLFDDKQVRAASGFAKMLEAAGGDERRIAEADREVQRDAGVRYSGESQLSPENERLLRLRKKGEGKTPYPFTEEELDLSDSIAQDAYERSQESLDMMQLKEETVGISEADAIAHNKLNAQAEILDEPWNEAFADRLQRNQPNPQIETPEFKKWFGDSKVVDSEGKPTILYHGTTSDFNSIDLSKLDSNALYGPGFYMTDNKNIAAGDTGYSYKGLLKDKHRVRYMELLPNESLAEARKRYYKDELDVYRETNPETVNEQKDWMDSLTYVLSKDKKALEVFEGVEGKANVMPLFAKIDKPFNMEMDVHESDLRAIASALEKQGDSEHLTEAYQNLNEKTYDNILWADLYQEYKQLASEYGEKVYAKEAFTDALKSLGYDGITHKGGQIRGHGIPHKVWIAFDPVKVKSAIGNRGTFDPKNPDIRYSTETLLGKPFRPLRAEIDKVEQDFGAHGKTVAGDFDKGFRGFYEHKDALTGQLNGEGLVNQYLNKLNPMEWFVTRTNPDIEKAGEILLAKSYGKTAPAPTPKQQEIINTIRDNLLKSVALKNAEPTLKKTIPDPNYYPQVPKDTVLNTLLNKVGTPEYARLVKDFIDYHRSIGTPDPNKKLQEFLGGYEKQEVSLASSFGPVDKSAGVGIPPSWAESSPTKVMPRFNNRYARRIAYERAINKHKDVLDALEEIKRADTVKNVLYDIQGKTEYNEAWRNAAGGVIRAGMLGPLTGAKDFVSNLTLGLQHTNPLDLAAGTVSALSNFKENWKRSFETGVNRHNFGTLEIGDGGIDAVSSVLRRVRDTLNSVQGRNILELVNRTIAVGQGNFLAQAALDAGKKGRLSGIQNKFLQDFAPDWRKATITPEYVSSVAARYARSVQGSYDYRGLPALTQKGSLAPVLSLARWNVEKFNNFRKYVVDPAYEGNLTPLLMSTIGMFIGGTAVQKLVEEVTGKKEKTAKWEEIRSTWNDPDATTKDAIAYKLAAIASLSGYAGVMGDLVKSGMDVMHKNMPTGYGNPLLEGLANAGRLTNELAEALREGNFDVTADLMSQIAEDYLQSYRLAINKLSPEKQDRQEQTNRNRDLRVWKQLTGQDVSEYSGKRVNPFTDQDSREFKRTSDISRAAELLPELITSAIAKSKGDPEKLKSELSKLKRNSYQTLPSPEKTPMTFLKYIQYLTESQGEEKASEALLDYFTQVGLNQAKSEMIPSL